MKISLVSSPNITAQQNFLNWIDKDKNAIAIILVTGVIAYSKILQNLFVIDDATFIKNWDITHSWSRIGSLLAGALPAGQEGVYRPVRSLLYLVYYHLFGTNPFWYHLHGLIVHIICVVLVYKILKLLLKNQTIAFFGGLIFSVLPIHTEVVAYASASMELTGIAFFFGAFYWFVKSSQTQKKRARHIVISTILAFFAFFTYEVTIILPVLCALYLLCFTKFKKSRFLSNASPLLFIFSPLAVYLFVRIGVLHIVGRGSYPVGAIPIILVTVKAWFLYFILTLFPSALTHNHIIPTGIEAILYRGHSVAVLNQQSIAQPWFVLSFFTILLLIGTAIYFYKKLPSITFGIGWFFLSLLPISNIVPQGTFMHEKFAYVPSFGLVIAVFGIITVLYKKTHRRRAVIVACIVVTFLYGSITITRNLDWYNEFSLWKKDISRAPTQNAYAYFQLGNAYSKQNFVQQSIDSYKKAFSINPHFAVAAASVARAYDAIGDEKQTEIYYQKAIAADSMWEAHFNLGNLYAKAGHFEQAAEEYRQTLAINPAFIPAKNNLAALQEQPSQPVITSLPVKKQTRASGVSFSVPQNWTIEQTASGAILTSGDKTTTISIQEYSKPALQSTTDFIAQAPMPDGTLTKQGQALIPIADASYARFFQSQSLLLQLFLFKDTRVLDIRVSPFTNSAQPTFDAVVKSIQL